MRGRLVIFCGVPGSGKTTVARMVAERLEKTILIQTDAVRGMLSRPNFSGEESRFVYEGCMAVAKEALRNGYTVFLDGTFMREDYRNEATEKLGRYSTRIDVVYIECGLATALKRNSARRASIPVDRLRSIYERFEVPRRAIRIDSARLSPTEAAARVAAALL